MAGQDRVLTGEAGAHGDDLSVESVRAQLARILGSRTFSNAPSLSRFLRHVVEHTLEGNAEELKEYSLGVEVFDRGESFDPRTDTIVRVQARMLRSKLKDYYDAEGQADPIVIELPKGHYGVTFALPLRESMARRCIWFRPLRRTETGLMERPAKWRAHGLLLCRPYARL